LYDYFQEEWFRILNSANVNVNFEGNAVILLEFKCLTFEMNFLNGIDIQSRILCRVIVEVWR
jgi:hypothetical protein